MGQDENRVEIIIDAAATKTAVKAAKVSDEKLQEFARALKNFSKNTASLTRTLDTTASHVKDFNKFLGDFNKIAKKNLVEMHENLVADLEPKFKKDITEMVQRVVAQVEHNAPKAATAPKDNKQKVRVEHEPSPESETAPKVPRKKRTSAPKEDDDDEIKERGVSVSRIKNVVRDQWNPTKQAMEQVADTIDESLRKHIVTEQKTINGVPVTVTTETADVSKTVIPDTTGKISAVLDKSLDKRDDFGHGFLNDWSAEFKKAEYKAADRLAKEQEKRNAELVAQHKKEVEAEQLERDRLLNKEIAAQKKYDDDRSNSLRRQITGGLIIAHAARVLAESSDVFSSEMSIVGRGFTDIMNAVLLPLMPVFVQVAQWFHAFAAFFRSLPTWVQQIAAFLVITKLTSAAVGSFPFKEWSGSWKVFKKDMSEGTSVFQKFLKVLGGMFHWETSGQFRGATSWISKKLGWSSPADDLGAGEGVGEELGKKRRRRPPGGGLLRRRAEGGPVASSNEYLVGEEGPEIFVPGRANGGEVDPPHRPLPFKGWAVKPWEYKNEYWKDVPDNIGPLPAPFGPLPSEDEYADTDIKTWIDAWLLDRKLSPFHITKDEMQGIGAYGARHGRNYDGILASFRNKWYKDDVIPLDDYDEVALRSGPMLKAHVDPWIEKGRLPVGMQILRGLGVTEGRRVVDKGHNIGDVIDPDLAWTSWTPNHFVAHDYANKPYKNAEKLMFRMFADKDTPLAMTYNSLHEVMMGRGIPLQIIDDTYEDILPETNDYPEEGARIFTVKPLMKERNADFAEIPSLEEVWNEKGIPKSYLAERMGPQKYLEMLKRQFYGDVNHEAARTKEHWDQIAYVTGHSKDLPRRAMGGPVLGHGAYIVGEKGPELFVPKRSGTIIPNHKAFRAEGGPVEAVGGSAFVTNETTTTPSSGVDGSGFDPGSLIGALLGGGAAGGLMYSLTGDPLLSLAAAGGGGALGSMIGPELPGMVAGAVGTMLQQPLVQGILGAMNILNATVSSIFAPLGPIMGIMSFATGGILGYLKSKGGGGGGGDGRMAAEATGRSTVILGKAINSGSINQQYAIGGASRGTNNLLSAILLRLGQCLRVDPCVGFNTLFDGLKTALVALPTAITAALAITVAAIAATITYTIATVGQIPVVTDIVAKIRYVIETIGEKPVVADTIAKITYTIEKIGEVPAVENLVAKITYTREVIGAIPEVVDRGAKITYEIVKIGTEPIVESIGAKITYTIETVGKVPAVESITNWIDSKFKEISEEEYQRLKASVEAKGAANPPELVTRILADGTPEVKGTLDLTPEIDLTKIPSEIVRPGGNPTTPIDSNLQPPSATEWASLADSIDTMSKTDPLTAYADIIGRLNIEQTKNALYAEWQFVNKLQAEVYKVYLNDGAVIDLQQQMGEVQFDIRNLLLHLDELTAAEKTIDGFTAEITSANTDAVRGLDVPATAVVDGLTGEGIVEVSPGVYAYKDALDIQTRVQMGLVTPTEYAAYLADLAEKARLNPAKIPVTLTNDGKIDTGGVKPTVDAGVRFTSSDGKWVFDNGVIKYIGDTPTVDLNVAKVNPPTDADIYAVRDSVAAKIKAAGGVEVPVKPTAPSGGFDWRSIFGGKEPEVKVPLDPTVSQSAWTSAGRTAGGFGVGAIGAYFAEWNTTGKVPEFSGFMGRMVEGGVLMMGLGAIETAFAGTFAGMAAGVIGAGLSIVFTAAVALCAADMAIDLIGGIVDAWNKNDWSNMKFNNPALDWAYAEGGKFTMEQGTSWVLWQNNLKSDLLNNNNNMRELFMAGIPVDVKFDIDSVNNMVGTIAGSNTGGNAITYNPDDPMQQPGPDPFDPSTPVVPGAPDPFDNTQPAPPTQNGPLPPMVDPNPPGMDSCPPGQTWNPQLQNPDGSWGACEGMMFAAGGRPPVGAVSLGGEKGPELFIPDAVSSMFSGNSSTPQVSAAAQNSQPVTVYQTYHVQTNNPRELVDTVMRELKLEMNRVKN